MTNCNQPAIANIGNLLCIHPKKNFPRLSCSQCILQWTYTAGNNWGVCSNGTGELGCGPQETFRWPRKILCVTSSWFLCFRACSDIRILPSGKRKPAPSKVFDIWPSLFDLLFPSRLPPSLTAQPLIWMILKITTTSYLEASQTTSMPSTALMMTLK